MRVRLQTAALPDLLARYDFNWTIDLAEYELVADEPPAPTSGAPNDQQTTPGPDRRALAEGAEAKWKLPKDGASPLQCETSINAFVKTTPVKVELSGKPKIEFISSRLDAALPPGRFRLVLSGDLVLSTMFGNSHQLT